MVTPGMVDGRLVGRDREWSAVLEAERRAQAGRSVVVHLVGPAGIGKTALMAAFARQTADGDVPLWVTATRQERDTAYAAAEVLLGAPVEGNAVDVGRRLLARFGPADLARGLAVVLIDDAQWLDERSADALTVMLRRSPRALLLLVAHRPGPSAADSLHTPGPDGTIVVRLAALDDLAVAELARRILGRVLPEDALAVLRDDTGGVPLLLDARLRADLDQSEAAHPSPPGDAVLAMRTLVSTVSDPARALLEAAAVFGEGVRPTTMADIAGVGDAGAAAEAVDELVHAGLLSWADPARLVVAPPALARAIRAGLSLSRRRTLHARAVRWTSGGHRLEHRVGAAAGPDPGLAEELSGAAGHARIARRYAEAASLRLHAAGLTPDSHRSDALVVEAVIDLLRAPDPAGVARLLPRVEQMPDGPRKSLALGLHEREQAHIGEALTHLYSALRTADPADALADRAALAVADLHTWLDQGEAAIRVLTEHATGHGARQDPELAGDITSTLALGHWQIGDEEGAVELLDTVALTPDGSSSEADLLAIRSLVKLYAGHVRAAQRDLDRTIELAHLWRPSTYQSRIFLMRSLSRFELGDWDGADADAQAAREIAEGRAEPWSIPLARAISIGVPARRGDWATAFDHLERARAALVGDLADQLVYVVVTHNEVVLHQARGDHEAVIRILEPLVTAERIDELVRFQSYRWLLPPWISTCVAVDRVADAEQGLELYERLVRRRPGGPLPDRLGWLRGLVAQVHGESEQAEKHFRADLVDPALLADPFCLAELHQAAGRLAHLTRNARGAARHLLAAGDLYARLGARPYLERCQAEAVAFGLSSSDGSRHGLTEREDVVATLVRRGYSNKEVARELFVTTKAVEYHLTRIYTKLGITGRNELRRRYGPA